MQLKSIVLSALMGSAAAIQRCSAPDPTQEQIDISVQMQIDEASHLSATGDQMHIAATIATNVYFHVVASGQTEASGYLSVGLNRRERRSVLN